MNRNKIIPLVLLGSMLFIAIIPSTSAITQEELVALGAGFHEPSEDWWDETYQHRILINFTNTGNKDTNIATGDIDFGDYFTSSDGIIDLASMQLVKVGANQSSQPVNFQIETDAVDIWNPPTMSDIEGVLIQSALEENGTFIGTVFNSLQGTGLMNQSFRFQAYLDDPADEVRFQFVYQPEFEQNVTDSDYIEIYAGIPAPGGWGQPIRVYRRDLPDEKAWTGYITLPLESTLSGAIWINMEAPTLFGAPSFRHFSIDFVFVDARGFDGRKVTHFVPELGPATDITQEVYYPRVQVLEKTEPPECTIYSSEPPESAVDKYYLYFNFMDESNHRLIENEAVPLVGELQAPQTYVDLISDGGVLRIDTDENNTEASMSVNMTGNDLAGTIFESGMNITDAGFDYTKTFGTQKTVMVHENITTSLVYTQFPEGDFLDVVVETSAPILMFNNLTNASTSNPFTHVATNTSVVALDSLAGVFYESDYIALFNNESDQFLFIASNDTISFQLQVDGTGPNCTIEFPVIEDTRFKIMIVNATESYVDNSTAVTTLSEIEYTKYMNRLSSPVQVSVSTVEDVFAPMQLALVSGMSATRIIVAGNQLGFALYGHNLQSMTVNIDNVTTDVAINGTYTIDLTGRNRAFWERRHVIVVTGRNEFDQLVTLNAESWIAGNTLDIAWTFVVYSFTTIAGLIGTLIAAFIPLTIARNKRRSRKKNDCIGGQCNV